jgi:outer membrane protein
MAMTPTFLATLSLACYLISCAASAEVTGAVAGTDKATIQTTESIIASADFIMGSPPVLSATDWGIAFGLRRAVIPYGLADDTSGDKDVYDILPLITFENDYGFIHGLEAGIHLWKAQDHQVNVYSRFRFVDIPKEMQNEVYGQSFDFGLQYRYFDGPWEADVALLSDHYKRAYAYTRARYQWNYGNWQLTPFAELQWKSTDFNNYYYGFNQDSTGAGVSATGGVEGVYHVTSNLYLIGQFAGTRLEDDVVDMSTVEKRYQLESFFGIGFYPAPDSQYTSSRLDKKNDEFLRVSHGWATPSNIGEVLVFNAERDPENNQMSSIFYGTQVADSLFTLPIDIYFTPGFVWHYSSDIQHDIAEGVIAIKVFYTFELGPRWRFGLAEGLSYVSKVTYIEGFELVGEDSKRGYENPSKLLNYIDFSVDVNVGDLFDSKRLAKTWVGYSIHHRSGIFESSSMFGRIKGGSNYQAVYVQWHF